MTDRQGHPIYDNQNQRTVGARADDGDYHFLEKMSHFDRERIPERVVHEPHKGIRLLCGLVRRETADARENVWPPILGLFRAVVVALT